MTAYNGHCYQFDIYLGCHAISAVTNTTLYGYILRHTDNHQWEALIRLLSTEAGHRSQHDTDVGDTGVEVVLFTPTSVHTASTCLGSWEALPSGCLAGCSLTPLSEEVRHLASPTLRFQSHRKLAAGPSALCASLGPPQRSWVLRCQAPGAGYSGAGLPTFYGTLLPGAASGPEPGEAPVPRDCPLLPVHHQTGEREWPGQGRAGPGAQPPGCWLPGRRAGGGVRGLGGNQDLGNGMVGTLRPLRVRFLVLIKLILTLMYTRGGPGCPTGRADSGEVGT